MTDPLDHARRANTTLRRALADTTADNLTLAKQIRELRRRLVWSRVQTLGVIVIAFGCALAGLWQIRDVVHDLQQRITNTRDVCAQDVLLVPDYDGLPHYHPERL